MSKYVQSLPGLIQTQAAAASLVAPSAITDGLDISSFSPRSGAGYPLAVVTLFADGAATVTDAALWGYEPTHARWGFIAFLNNDSVVTLSATRSYYQEVDIVGVFSRLAVVGTVAGGNNVGYSIMPIAEMY